MKERNNKNQRVVVVGSSPSLLGLKMGKIIDSYDIVVRVNWWPPHDYEDDIGSKTDWLFVGWEGDNRMVNIHNKRNIGYQSSPTCNQVMVGFQKDLTPERLDLIKKTYNAKRVVLANKYINQWEEKNEFCESVKSYGLRIKSGINAIIALHLMTNRPVDIIGFGPQNMTSYGYYYNTKNYQISRRTANPANHINALKRLGVINRELDDSLICHSEGKLWSDSNFLEKLTDIDVFYNSQFSFFVNINKEQSEAATDVFTQMGLRISKLASQKGQDSRVSALKTLKFGSNLSRKRGCGTCLIFDAQAVSRLVKNSSSSESVARRLIKLLNDLKLELEESTTWSSCAVNEDGNTTYNYDLGKGLVKGTIFYVLKIRLKESKSY